MAANGGKSSHESFWRLLPPQHFWVCLFACALLFIATSSAVVSSTSIKGPSKILKLVYKESEAQNNQVQQASAPADDEATPLPPAYETSDSSDSESEEDNAEDDEPSIDNSDDGDTFKGALKHQFSLADNGKEPDVVGTILAVGRRANPNLDNSRETVANAGEFEKIRSSSWEAPAFSVVTDEDLVNNVVVERVLRPSETFSLQLPRKLSTSPRNLYNAAHPVVMGECHTSKTVSYNEIFDGVPSSHEFWTTYPASGSTTKLVFTAPSEAVVKKSGKNAQFCFTVFDPKKSGIVTLWVQVRSSGVFPACLDGNCRRQQGGKSTEPAMATVSQEKTQNDHAYDTKHTEGDEHNLDLPYVAEGPSRPLAVVTH